MGLLCLFGTWCVTQPLLRGNVSAPTVHDASHILDTVILTLSSIPSHLAEVLPAHPECEPAWKKNYTECPYGTKLPGDITLPDYDKARRLMAPLSLDVPSRGVLYAAVCYSTFPYFLGFWVFGLMVYNRSTADLHFLIYLVFLVGSNEFLLKRWIGQQRPMMSCLTSCGMPSGHAVLAVGTLIQFIMNGFLTARSRKGSRTLLKELCPNLANYDTLKDKWSEPVPTLRKLNDLLGHPLPDEKEGKKIKIQNAQTREGTELNNGLQASTTSTKTYSDLLEKIKEERNKLGFCSRRCTSDEALVPEDFSVKFPMQFKGIVRERDRPGRYKHTIMEQRRKRFWRAIYSLHCPYFDEPSEHDILAILALWTIFIFPVPLSRVQLSDHTPFQVFVGTGVGCVLAFCWLLFSQRIQRCMQKSLGERFLCVEHNWAAPCQSMMKDAEDFLLERPTLQEILPWLHQVDWYQRNTLTRYDSLSCKKACLRDGPIDADEDSYLKLRWWSLHKLRRRLILKATPDSQKQLLMQDNNDNILLEWTPLVEFDDKKKRVEGRLGKYLGRPLDDKDVVKLQKGPETMTWLELSEILDGPNSASAKEKFPIRVRNVRDAGTDELVLVFQAEKKRNDEWLEQLAENLAQYEKLTTIGVAGEDVGKELSLVITEDIKNLKESQTEITDAMDAQTLVVSNELTEVSKQLTAMSTVMQNKLEELKTTVSDHKANINNTAKSHTDDAIKSKERQSKKLQDKAEDVARAAAQYAQRERAARIA